MSDEQIRETVVPQTLPEVDYRLQRRFTHHELKADRAHLRILALCYTWVAFLLGLAVIAAVWYLMIGILIVAGVMGQPGPGEVRGGVALIVLSPLAGAAFWTLARYVIVAARSLKGLKRYKYCMITAALFCALPPLGTALGLCTILVLLRDSVKELFIHGEFAFQPDLEDD